MQRYDSYKNSGVKWLGEIPGHWETKKSKYLWKESFSVSENGNEGCFLFHNMMVSHQLREIQEVSL